MSISRRLRTRGTIQLIAAVLLWLASGLLGWVYFGRIGWSLLVLFLTGVAILRLMLGPLNHPTIVQLLRWESEFGALAVDHVDSSVWVRGTSGMGRYGGYFYPMRVALDPDALYIELLGGAVAPVRIPWSRIAMIRCGALRMAGERQPVAALITRNLEHQDTLIPWSEALVQHVPMSVGLRDDGFQIGIRASLWKFISGR